MSQEMQQIELPLLWKLSTNKIYNCRHWKLRNDDKNNYHNYYVPIFRMKLNPVVFYPLHIDYVFKFKKTPLDSSNCSYMGKLIEDCLIISNIIKNDNPKHVKTISYTSIKDVNDKVLIKIKGVKDE